MKVLSLKLKDEVFEEAEKMIKHVNISRNGYINEAIEFYNKLNRRKYLAHQLKNESRLGREESLKVLKDLEFIDEHLIP